MTTVPFYLNLYDKFILGKPRVVLLMLLSLTVFFGYQINNFRLDASADSLILEHDEDLKYFRTISERYSSGDYLLVTYTSQKDIFSKDNLAGIKKLRKELSQLDNVSSVVSIFDVPLLSSPPVPLTELRQNIKTLAADNVDKVMARKEISNSPIYTELLVSKDMRSTAIQINLVSDTKLKSLFRQRNLLNNKKHEGSLSAVEKEELKRISYEYSIHQEDANRKRHNVIIAIRKVMKPYLSTATLFLGGVPMIADDMVTFIKNDIKTFGLGMVCFLIITLWVIFKKLRWVVLSMLCCAFSAIIMTGLVSLFRWQVTVISSNFISLQLVITMSITIHMIVRYKELMVEKPSAKHRNLVLETASSIFKPCVYTTLTTIAGFSSLLVSDILPIINFGWMMTVGLVVSLFITFLTFPAGLMLVEKEEWISSKEIGNKLTTLFARLTKNHGTGIYISTLLIIVLTLAGIFRLTVENSFIDYFRDSTEIYQGMKLIDQNLGGTTPLDLIIDFEVDSGESQQPALNDSDEFDEFDEFGEFEQEGNSSTYWFTPDRLELVAKVHNILDGFPEIGKIISLHTMMQVIDKLSGKDKLDNLSLTLLFNELPEEFKEKILNPYVSVENNQARFSMRINDSMKSLKRDRLLKTIKSEVVGKLNLKEEQVHLAGVMVLYNNMLQSLFHSQIETIGFTLLALMVMFLILFRSFKLSLIALFPNLISSLVVLGVMGMLNIPLDMMTITIVAISIGIAVDDTVHYIHRFKHEFEIEKNYIKVVYKCHGSIGNAIFYTSITIVIGFSILALSNFIPSILFGLLTGLAMLMALIASLTLLPRLIILIKPFGPEER